MKNYVQLSLLKRNKNAKKRKSKNVDKNISDCVDPRKTEMVIDFSDRECTSIKSFAVRNKSVVKATPRFMSGKLLMFAKLSLKSFIYDLAETFLFSVIISQRYF